MFKIKHIKEVCADPISSICDIGRFDGPYTTYGDLVFVREGIDSMKTFMNSNVFRELLLSNPQLLVNTTGVVCLDAKEYNDIIDSLNALRTENEQLKKEATTHKRKARVDIGGVQ